MPLPVLVLLNVLAVSLLSLLGIVFFLLRESFIERILLYIVSLSTGALLGDVFIPTGCARLTVCIPCFP
jgi:hypothetical protein